jgi:hypothetical protein
VPHSGHPPGMHSGHFSDAGFRSIQPGCVSPAFSTTPSEDSRSRFGRRAAGQPVQPDYNLAPAAVSSRAGPGSEDRYPNAGISQIQSFAGQVLLQKVDCPCISSYAIHSGWVNQKPPTNASCDRQAVPFCIFHKCVAPLSVCRIVHKQDHECAASASDNPGTSAIPIFRSRRKQAEKEYPIRSRQADVHGTTRVSDSQKQKLIDYPRLSMI